MQVIARFSSELDSMMAVKLKVEALYRSYGHRVLHRAHRILASEDEAAEVLQELFTSLVARPSSSAGVARRSPSTRAEESESDKQLRLSRYLRVHGFAQDAWLGNELNQKGSWL